ncbi:MAG TPA: DUF3987 domain-containing protein [Gammaproteobacteria bacterium]|nr:DUF3987 domain-containing protein [Gammaproteobacteria bacterium]
MTANNINDMFANAPEDQESDHDIPLAAMPSIHKDAFFGVLMSFVDVASKNSEASSVAVAANVMAWFSAILGRSVCQWIGDTKIHCRPFPLLVGRSGKARKGTSEGLPRRVFSRVDEMLKVENPSHSILNVHGGGLSSGEGISYAIRDAVDEKDLGVLDKRLLVIEAEFANVLANCKREGSTLSPVIRNTFDGRDLAPLTKRDQTRATKPHVVILGHITCHELQSRVSSGVEVFNGLLNRFLICLVAREKLVPLPEMTLASDIDQIAGYIVDVLKFVHAEKVKCGGEVVVSMSPAVQKHWGTVYSQVSRDIPGVVGSLLARTEVYCRMLAMIFAVLDKKSVIELAHLKSALRWIVYMEESVRYLFSKVSEKANEEKLVLFAEEIFMLLKAKGGMTRTDISGAFSRHKAAKEITDALKYLLSQSPARIVQTIKKTPGRSKEVYSAKEEKKEK